MIGIEGNVGIFFGCFFWGGWGGGIGESGKSRNV